MSQEYVHGYSPEEQQRLVTQSQRWQWLIQDRLDYQPNDCVLEMGCAAGTTLGVLAECFSGIQLAGIDISPSQINFAENYLAQFYLQADLQQGSAYQLPWADQSFDHVFMMWFVEHLETPLVALDEAYRVLKPGGSISIIETDYRSYQVSPRHVDYTYLNETLSQLFDTTGNASIGRELGSLLHRAGFQQVDNQVYPLHFIGTLHAEKITSHVEYTLEFIEMMLDDMVTKLNADKQKLLSGINHLRSIANRDDGALTHLIYKATAVK